MSRRAAGFVLFLAFLLLVGGLGWIWFSRHPLALGGGGKSGAGVEGKPVVGLDFDLFFPADGGLLKAERRKLQVTDDTRDRIRKLVRALLDGPEGQGRYRPFPEGVQLGSILLTPNGTAYVDLSWPGHPDPPASGSQEEAQRLWSVVNTITYNVTQVKNVVILWEGRQRDTFAGPIDAGHIDTSLPLTNNPEMVAP